MASEPQKLSIQQIPFEPPAQLSETDPPSHTSRLRKGGLPKDSRPEEGKFQVSGEYNCSLPYNAKPIRVGWSNHHVNIKPDNKSKPSDEQVAQPMQDTAYEPVWKHKQIKGQNAEESGEALPKPRSWLVRAWENLWYGSKTPVPLLDDKGELSSIVRTWVQEQLYSLKQDASISNDDIGEALLNEADWLQLSDEICKDLKRQGSTLQVYVLNNGVVSLSKQKIEEHTRRVAINDLAKAAHDKMWDLTHLGNVQMHGQIEKTLSEFKDEPSFEFLTPDDWHKIGVAFYEEAQRVRFFPKENEQLRLAALKSIWSHVLHLQKERYDKVNKWYYDDSLPGTYFSLANHHDCREQVEKANEALTNSQEEYQRTFHSKELSLEQAHQYENEAKESKKKGDLREWKRLMQEAEAARQRANGPIEPDVDDVIEAATKHAKLVDNILERADFLLDFDNRKLKKDIESEFEPLKSIEGLNELSDHDWEQLTKTCHNTCSTNSQYELEHIRSSAYELAAKQLLQWHEKRLDEVKKKHPDLDQDTWDLECGSSSDVNKQIEGFRQRIDSKNEFTVEELNKYASKFSEQLREVARLADKIVAESSIEKANRLRLLGLDQELETCEQRVDQIESDVPKELLPAGFRSTFDASRDKVRDHLKKDDYDKAKQELASIEKHVDGVRNIRKTLKEYRANLKILRDPGQQTDRWHTKAAIAIANNMQPQDAKSGFTQNDFGYALHVVTSFEEFAAAPSGKAMIARLEQFARDPSLVEALNSVHAPYSNGPLNNSIRAMLGIPLEPMFIERQQARRAVLAAVLHGVPGDASIEQQISTFTRLVDGELKTRSDATDEEFRNREITLTVPGLHTETDKKEQSKMIDKQMFFWSHGGGTQQPGDKLLAGMFRRPNIYVQPRPEAFWEDLCWAANEIAKRGSGDEVTINLAELLTKVSTRDLYAKIPPKPRETIAKLRERHDQRERLLRQLDSSETLQQRANVNREINKHLRYLDNFAKDSPVSWHVAAITPEDRVGYLRARIRTDVDGLNPLVDAYQNIDRSESDNDTGNATTITIESQ